MTTHESNTDAGFTLAAMQTADIPAVMAIQQASFTPDLVESAAVIADRFARFGGHFLMARKAGEPAGYALCFPWRLGDIPSHNKPFPAVLPRPDGFFLQDISLAPSARGQGLAQLMLARMLAHASSLGADSFSLVAVAQSGDYWDRQGFSSVPDRSPAQLDYVSAQYGEGARLMYRDLRTV